MSYSVIFFKLLVLCGSIIMMLPGCESNKVPQVVFPSWKYQFPTPFIVGTEMNTTFSFRNEGNAILRIKRVDTSCGCIATNTSAKQIPPGGTGVIQVEIDRDVGRFIESVQVYTNDPTTPIINLQVWGVILPVITYPKKIELGQLEKGKRVSKEITFTNNLKNAVEITEHTVSNKSIAVTLPKKSISAGESMECEVVLTVNDVGLYSESLTLSTHTQEALPGTDSKDLEMSIQFQGRVLGGIVVLPQNLFLGVLDGSGKSVQKKVRIKTDGSRPFALKKVTADNFSVTASLSQEPQMAHEVVLSITPKTDSPSSGLVEGEIQIFTTYPDVPKITVPVKAVRQ